MCSQRTDRDLRVASANFWAKDNDRSSHVVAVLRASDKYPTMNELRGRVVREKERRALRLPACCSTIFGYRTFVLYQHESLYLVVFTLLQSNHLVLRFKLTASKVSGIPLVAKPSRTKQTRGYALMIFVSCNAYGECVTPIKAPCSVSRTDASITSSESPLPPRIRMASPLPLYTTVLSLRRIRT